MPVWLESLLGWLYPRIPPGLQSPLKNAFLWTQIRLAGLLSRRTVRKGHRVAFLDFEIAHLEPFEYLSPDRSEIEVEARYSTVSPGTERAVLCGLPGARRAFSYFPGYSLAGEVRAVGSRVRGIKPGDRVAGRVKHASGDSVSADFLFRVPDGVHLSEASFIELGIITLQGIRKARITPGDTVAIVGQGLIGQLANRAARTVGAGRVIAVAPSRNRAATALAPGGATEFISLNAGTHDLAAIEADVVIEAVGNAEAILLSARCARRGGKVVLLGSSRGLSRDVELGALLKERDITMVGAHISDMPTHDSSPGRHTYRQEGELFLDMLRSRRLSVAELVTWQPAPGDCNAVYEVLAAGGREHVAIVFDWQLAGGKGASQRPTN
jgi:threonine dehydrogenase-like Zn-dependent dehydrogenase